MESPGNLWTHILILIPLEFGLLHATPLGGMLVSGFQSLFGALGFQFAAAAAHGAPGHVCAAGMAAAAPVMDGVSNAVSSALGPVLDFNQ